MTLPRCKPLQSFRSISLIGVDLIYIRHISSSPLFSHWSRPVNSLSTMTDESVVNLSTNSSPPSYRRQTVTAPVCLQYPFSVGRQDNAVELRLEVMFIIFFASLFGSFIVCLDYIVLINHIYSCVVSNSI